MVSKVFPHLTWENVRKVWFYRDFCDARLLCRAGSQRLVAASCSEESRGLRRSGLGGAALIREQGLAGRPVYLHPPPSHVGVLHLCVLAISAENKEINFLIQ